MKLGPDTTDKNKGKYARTSPIYVGEPKKEETKKNVTKKKVTKKKTKTSV